MNLDGLLRIEYAFHFTLIVAAIVVARYFLAVAGAPACHDCVTHSTHCLWAVQALRPSAGQL